MKAGLLFFAAAVALALVLKYRLDARRGRNAVIERMTQETSATGVTSPTEELFRSVGAPISDDLRAGLASAPPPSPKPGAATAAAATPSATAATPSATATIGSPTLETLCRGIRLPCELAPLVSSEQANSSETLSFSTSAGHLEGMGEALGSAFGEIGCSLSWIDAKTAVIRRGSDGAVMTIYPEPERIVVKLTAA